jgi:threonine dehydratase
MISYRDIETAHKTVCSVVHHTPLLSSKSFDAKSGNTVCLKAENFQRIGAFKIRGAYNRLANLSAEEKKRGVIAHSSGNHAQGVALAANILGVKAVIVMPNNSPAIKVDATRSYGAEIRFCEDSSDARVAMASEIQKREGYVMVPPFDDDYIIAGQGTLVLEIAEQVKQLDYLFVPVGGGGLIGGCSIAAKHHFPAIKVIGVETEAANDCYQTFRKKEIVKIAPPDTIADGMRTQAIGKRNFEILMNYVDDVITVSDDETMRTMKFLLERMKIVVEPTGAVAPAAVYFNKLGLKGKNICAIISGGNVSPDVLKRVIDLK